MKFEKVMWWIWMIVGIVACCEMGMKFEKVMWWIWMIVGIVAILKSCGAF